MTDYEATAALVAKIITLALVVAVCIVIVGVALWVFRVLAT